MFGLGIQELLIILVLVLILFGAGKLPQVGGSLGKGVKNFKKGLSGEDEKDEEAEKPNDSSKK
ncbi:MAG: twin-arginine translocase TatA/TatE family subunit [Desulfuromonadaceae bacterium]|nr:twin-arginine translocase TatA/TatE family subunit [Desulfuromonadaceae bacterium]